MAMGKQLPAQFWELSANLRAFIGLVDSIVICSGIDLIEFGAD
jgi:hypothetical protein